ncbi:MAG: hypothetical protein MJ095_03285 [Oscillospiraceae bacterium]|nr:hypothetical protein [Oscillospiraceae bacterium]
MMKRIIVNTITVISLHLKNRINNPERKTRYDLIAVYKKNPGLVNIDSQAPNRIVKEWLEGRPDLFSDITVLKPEYTEFTGFKEALYPARELQLK